ncbi:MAG TPA: S8 family serine peptidase [Actinomycetota bacterium]|nr:S8 family serine peptidase [Actinomycetota bacterium]
MRIKHLLPAAAALSVALAAQPAAAAPYVDDRVVVRYEDGASRAERADVQRDTGTGFEDALPGGSRTLTIEDGESVPETVRELNRDPDVDYAVPDYRVRKAQAAPPAPFIPNDPGRGRTGEDWRELQWNFAGEFGVNAPMAWAHTRGTQAPGGRGAVIAVIDSGVAYRDSGRFRRAPDLYRKRWFKPYDFIEEDRKPLDEDGHGTHVAGTIAQATNNRVGVTGLAYGATIMPLRVLDENGNGDGVDLARALRYAARNGADVINMSVEYTTDLKASHIPEVIEAMKYAHDRGAVLVGVAGNGSDRRLSYPARYDRVVAVGATTVRGCRAEYSNQGSGIDIVAPGGGQDADSNGSDWDDAHCDPVRSSRLIYQQTLWRGISRFALVGFEGTSSAAPHVAATAALVVATQRAAGARPAPDAVQERLQATARDLGAPGYDRRYGHGLLDAAAAVAPSAAAPPPSG